MWALKTFNLGRFVHVNEHEQDVDSIPRMKCSPGPRCFHR